MCMVLLSWRVRSIDWAISSAGEHCLHTAGVAGSNPASPTNATPPTKLSAARRPPLSLLSDQPIARRSSVTSERDVYRHRKHMRCVRPTPRDLAEDPSGLDQAIGIDRPKWLKQQASLAKNIAWPLRFGLQRPKDKDHGGQTQCKVDQPHFNRQLGKRLFNPQGPRGIVGFKPIHAHLPMIDPQQWPIPAYFRRQSPL